MTEVKYHKSDKERICRICGEKIEKGKTSILFENMKLGNKKHQVHFHASCLYKSLELLNEPD